MIARASGAGASPSSRGLVLFLLYALNTLLVLDKIIFTVLLEPIKAEFDLNDLQLGLLAGAVYAVCLGAASLPFGMLADRYSRRNLAAACLAFWSLMTALCGLARSFPLLLAARLGVGIGEAGGGPASLSMIADLYEHRRRATAMAIFSLGTPTAALINLTVNTRIAHDHGWRAALLAASLPGLVVALLLWLCIREPERSGGQRSSAPPLVETLRYVRSQRSLIHLLTGGMVAYIVLAGVSSWNFSFLVRVHKVKLADIGPLLGVTIAGAGMFGLLVSGRFADLLGRRDDRWRAWTMAATTLLSVGFGLGAFLAPSLGLAIACTAGLAATSSLWLAPGYALSQSLVPERMRGTVGALLFMLANVVGYGLGPPLVGWLSDTYSELGLASPLRAALVTAVICNSWAALHFLFSARTLTGDLRRSGVLPQDQKNNMEERVA